MGDCSVLAGRAEVLRGDGLVSNGAMQIFSDHWQKMTSAYTGINI
jgi:hypothetical protein